MAELTILCPVCGVRLPTPATDTVTPDHLTVMLDTTFIDEHAAMHVRCICTWGNGERWANTGCEVHR